MLEYGRSRVRAKAAYARATAAFAGEDAGLAALLEAATTAGIAP